MIIIATADKAAKKSMDKYIKIVISDVIEENKYGDIEGADFDDAKKVICTREFLPDPLTFTNFMSGFYSKKKFMKKYWEEIYDNKEKLASLMAGLIAYKQGKKVCYVCHEDEVEYGYLEALVKIISERYGIEVGTVKDVKNGKVKKNKIRRTDKLDSDIKRCRRELKELSGYSAKKDKKKKDKDKKKSKKKDKDFYYKSKDKKKKSKKKDHIEATFYEDAGFEAGFESRVKVVTMKRLFKNK